MTVLVFFDQSVCILQTFKVAHVSFVTVAVHASRKFFWQANKNAVVKGFQKFFWLTFLFFFQLHNGPILVIIITLSIVIFVLSLVNLHQQDSRNCADYEDERYNKVEAYPAPSSTLTDPEVLPKDQTWFGCMLDCKHLAFKLHSLYFFLPATEIASLFALRVFSYRYNTCFCLHRLEHYIYSVHLRCFFLLHRHILIYQGLDFI